ncbi:MAG: hypothetical protein GQ523_06390 [Methanophagales archaeon]|nr:hypothetical protein [Methanophagales archaeon]
MQLCEKLIRKMSRKRNVPFLSGRMEIWAVAIIHALGSINFLFDTSKEGSQKVKMYWGRCQVIGFRGLT